MGRNRFMIVVTGLVAIAVGSAATTAQEATPRPVPMQSGVTREPLTSEAVSQLQGVAGSLKIERVRITAGGEAIYNPDDVAVLVLVVESGMLDVESPSAATVQRGATENGRKQAESIAARTPISLDPQDSLVSLSPAGTHLRNPGKETISFISIGFGGGATASAEPAAVAGTEDQGLVMALALVVPPPCPPGTEPGSPELAATPGAGGGGGGAGGVAVAFAAAPACIDVGATPTP
jgi:hypothetical protein